MVSSIRLQNLRSYKDRSFDFSPSVNIIIGANGAGKTNLLEAILVLATGGSYRVKDHELLRHSAAWARLDGVFSGEERTLKLEEVDGSLRKSFILGGQKFSRLRLDRTIPVVLFEPNHLSAVTRGPEHRRAFIDELIESTNPAYKQTVASYRRTLAQRNRLLKKGRQEARKQIFAWNVRLSEIANQIVTARVGVTAQLNKNLPKVYSDIAKEKSDITVEYANEFPLENYASQMVARLEKNFDKDIERGFTSAGPHREDFLLAINGQLAATSASRGEIRSLLLSLKVLELGLVEEARRQKPILLLDDVFSELDSNRRAALVQRLVDHQTVITTTDADSVKNYFDKKRLKLIKL